MKRLVTRFLALGSLLVTLTSSGCIYLVVGGIGALGGYIISPDAVEGITDHDAMEVWDASVEIVSIMGTIQAQNEDTGTLQAQIGGADVTVLVDQLSASATKITVKARKYHLPHINTAQEVFVKIMSYLVG